MTDREDPGTQPGADDVATTLRREILRRLTVHLARGGRCDQAALREMRGQVDLHASRWLCDGTDAARRARVAAALDLALGVLTEVQALIGAARPGATRELRKAAAPGSARPAGRPGMPRATQPTAQG